MLRLLIKAVPIAALGLVCAFSSNAQDKIAQYRDKFERDTDPVRKAKDFQQLGDAQISEFAQAAAKDDYDGALRNLSDYRAEAHTCFDGLNAAVGDAEKHPEGFRQLQIHIRKGLWEIERTIPGIPESRRPDFRAIHDDLVDLQSKLIRLLFPRDSAAPKPKAKPKG